MENHVHGIYGGRLRVRVCGICSRGESLLLVRHSGLPSGDLWAPPGGGLDFGRSAASQLQSEFLEETGLRIEVGRFLFVCELVQPPLHAVELFFEVRETGGRLGIGTDSETREQIIQDVRFMSPVEMGALPKAELHGLFRFVGKGQKITDLSGYYRL